LVAGLLLCLAAGGVSWFYAQAYFAKELSDPERARLEGRPIPVRTDFVTESVIEKIVGATAISVPCEIVHVRIGPSRGLTSTSPVSDLVIKKVHIQAGDRIRRGDLLFELEDDLVKQYVKQREAALANAKATLDFITKSVTLNENIRKLNLSSAQMSVKFREEDLGIRNNLQELFKDLFKQRSGTKIEFFEAQSKLAMARSDRAQADVVQQIAKDNLTVGSLTDKRDLAKAQNDYETAKLDLETARHDLERTKIYSPLDGFVSKVPVIEGGTIGVADGLAHLVRLDPLYVKMDFPQERLDELALGQEAKVVFDSLPKETFTGKVIRILPEVNPELRVLPVIIEIPNPDNRLKAGLSGFVRLYQEKKPVRVVPAAAVIQEGGKAMVFRVEKDKARMREVKTGPMVENGFFSDL